MGEGVIHDVPFIREERKGGGAGTTLGFEHTKGGGDSIVPY